MTGDAVFRKGINRENPVAVLLLGLCPAAAVSVRVIDSLWMSVGVIAVMLLSSFSMSLISRGREGREGELRQGGSPGRWLAALMLSSCLTASFEIVLMAFAPEASATLGIYAPLIAVNCLVLTGIEESSHVSSIGRSLLAAAGNGIGFSACLVLIAVVREVLGAGTITLFPVAEFTGTIEIRSLSADPARALDFAGGGLLCLGYLAAVARSVGSRGGTAEGSTDGKR
jgi:electron transport complex protein RnfE